MSCYDAVTMPETLALPRATQEKFLQLAEFLEQASRLARELARGQRDRLSISDLTPPKPIPKDQAWFWSKEWQAGERQVNEEIRRGEYQTFESVDDLIADLHAHV